MRTTAEPHIEYLRRLDIRKYMETERPYLDPFFGVEQLCDNLGVTTRPLRRIMYEAYGKPGRQVIEDYRVDRVIFLMNRGYCGTLVDLARECGFNYYDAMNRAFSRRMGVTPGFYRRNLKKNYPEKFLKKLD